MDVLAGRGCKAFLVSVGGLDPSKTHPPVVASPLLAASQNLLAEEQQTSHQMHLALQRFIASPNSTSQNITIGTQIV